MSFEDMHWKLIQAFNGALESRREFELAQNIGAKPPAETHVQRLHVSAFVLAGEYGWNYAECSEFQNFAHKATDQEILSEGLRQALTHCRPQPARLDCNGCLKTFRADGSDGQLTELTGDVYDLLVAGADSVDHEAHKGSVFCDACILGLVRGLL